MGWKYSELGRDAEEQTGLTLDSCRLLWYSSPPDIGPRNAKNGTRTVPITWVRHGRLPNAYRCQHAYGRGLRLLGLSVRRAVRDVPAGRWLMQRFGNAAGPR